MTGSARLKQMVRENLPTLVKMRGYWDMRIFMREYFSAYCYAPFGQHHKEIFECIPRGKRGVRINIVAPRGSAKSVSMCTIYPLHRICYRAYDELLGYKPDDFILILSQTAEAAQDRVRSIKEELEMNDELRETFGNFVAKETWGVRRLHTTNDIWVVPLGRGGQIRGSLQRNKRPSLVISDDIDDTEKVENPEVRKKDHDWFNTDLQRVGNLDGSTNFVNVDTIKHEESITSVLQHRPIWKTLFYRAIEDPVEIYHPDTEAESLWKAWEKIFTDMTLDEDARVAAADQFYHEHEAQMTGGIKLLWPEMISYKDVREEVCDVGYWAVLRELQNSCRDPSKQIFNMQDAVRFKIQENGLLRSDDRFVRWADFSGGSVFLDWAGGKDSVDNAFAAAVAVLWEPMPGRRENVATLAGCHAYVINVWMDRVKLSIQIDNALELYEDAQALLNKAYDLKWRFGIENFVKDTTGAIEEYARSSFKEAKERRRTDARLEMIPRFTNKIERIAALEPAITHGWLCFHEKLSMDYYKQMELFPTADFVDGPDATEGACQLRIGEYPSVHRLKRERSRQQTRNFEVKL